MTLNEALIVCEKHCLRERTGKVYPYKELNSQLLVEAIQILVQTIIQEDGWSQKWLDCFSKVQNIGLIQ